MQINVTEPTRVRKQKDGKKGKVNRLKHCGKANIGKDEINRMPAFHNIITRRDKSEKWEEKE